MPTDSLPSAEQWREMLVDVPGALGAILQEVFASIDADRVPRRADLKAPAAPQRTAADVHAAVFPQYSTLPFAEALTPLLKPSMRAIADRVGWSPAYLRSLILGKRPLDAYKLETIARAVRVQPGYFREYRELAIAEAISIEVTRRPEVGIAAYRAVAKSSVLNVRTDARQRGVLRARTDAQGGVGVRS